MDRTPTILKSASQGLKLHYTTPLKGQEWCAITYLLVPEPKTSTYGTIKIICFGATCEEVDKIVGEMIVDGRLEKSLSFIQVIRTGDWRKLVAGGEKSSETVTMNTEDGTILSEVRKEAAKRNADATRELNARLKEVQEEAAGRVHEKPYDEYVKFRTQRSMAIQRKKQLEEEIKQVNQALGNAIVKIKSIESQHGNWRLKYDKKNGTVESSGEMKRLETELPEGYKEPLPWKTLNPREHDNEKSPPHHDKSGSDSE
jgi:hypothetical protein